MVEQMCCHLKGATRLENLGQSQSVPRNGDHNEYFIAEHHFMSEILSVIFKIYLNELITACVVAGTLN